MQVLQPELRLVLLDRDGSGNVTYIRVDGVREALRTTNISRDNWWQVHGVTDFSLEVVHDKLYVIGGYHKARNNCNDFMLRLNPEDGHWTEVPGMMARCRCATTVIKDKIYITGGCRSNGKPISSCEVFHVNRGVWEKSGILPSPRGNHACCVDVQTRNIYLSGGTETSRPQNNLWVYEDYKWQCLDRLYPQEMLNKRSHHAMVCVDGTLYFIGGKVKCKEPDNAIHVPKMHTLTVPTTRGRPTGNPSPGSMNGSIEAFRLTVSHQDTTSHTELISPWVFDLPPMNHPRLNPAVICLGRKIYVIGGTSETGDSVLDVEYYHIDKKKWCPAFKLPPGDYSNVACALLNFPPDQPFMPTDADIDRMDHLETGNVPAPETFSSEASAIFSTKGDVGQDSGRSKTPSYKGWILW